MSEKERLITKEDTNMSEKEDKKTTEDMKVGVKEKERLYRVFVNGKKLYSIWAVDQEIPNGWESVGPTGPIDICLSFVNEVWSDMSQQSLR